MPVPKPRGFFDDMVDLETADNKPGAAIVSLGAVFFDPPTGRMGPEFYRVVYLPSCEELGLTVSEDTLAWWAQQSPEVQKTMDAALTRRKSRPIADVLYEFEQYLKPAGENVRIWGNGSDFDNPILAMAFHACGQPLPWKFWNSRCFRTLKNMPGARRVVPERRGTHHNALDDAKHQAEHAIAILNQLKGA